MSRKDNFPRPLRLYRDLVEKSEDLFWQCDSEGRYIYLNPAWEKTFGYDLGEMLGKRFSDFQSPSFGDRDGEEFQRLLGGGSAKCYETVHLSKSGDEIHLIFTANPVRDDEDRIVGTAGTAYDITERRKTLLALQDQQDLLANLATQVPGMLYQFKMAPDGSLSLPYSSDGVKEIFGCTPADVVDKFDPIFEAIHPVDRPNIMETIKTSVETMSQWMCEYRVKIPGRPIKWVFGNSIPEKREDGSIVWCGYNMDITERKTAEEMLRNSQKLDAIGVLAGGIAHDFNNLLGGIYGYIDLAADLATDEQLSRYLSKTLETIDRAKSLTRQLLTFAKGGAPDRKEYHLFPFVEETTLFAVRGSTATCRFEIPEDLWICDFDKNQIGQVIDNIVINARQAMPTGGIISISAKNVVFNNREHRGLPGGRYVEVSIRDSGSGIPEEVLPYIFDPFFSTKPQGHGLGLTTCYSILKQHGGIIDVISEVGEGTTFILYLPASSGSPVASASNVKTTHSGEGTILVMDDEAVIRDTLEQMLKSFGYRVACTTNGSETVDYLLSGRHEARDIVAMIFDLTIPGDIGGQEVVTRIRRVDAATPIFVASGYADDPIMAEPTRFGFTASIGKPFRKAELARLLNEHMPRP